MRHFIALSLLLLTITAAVAQGTLAVGGEGIGKWHLGNNFSTMKAELGKPDEVRQVDSFTDTHIYFYKGRGLAFFVKGDRLSGITIFSASYATQDGLRVGSRRGEVERLLGHPQSLRSEDVVYPEKGLNFSYDSAGVVNRMYITEKEARDALKGDRTIHHGERIGGLRIGLPIAQVLSAWGKPDQTSPLPSRPGRTLMLFQDKGILAVVYQDQIEGITCISPEYGTPANLRVGCSRRDVYRIYGQHFVLASGIEAYKDKGIGFTYEDDKVTEITVLPPSP